MVTEFQATVQKLDALGGRNSGPLQVQKSVVLHIFLFKMGHVHERKLECVGKKMTSVIVLDLKISGLVASTILYNCKHHTFGFWAV